jgi:uncharacterized membrane protein YphA (DoxX/SURF4 family)
MMGFPTGMICAVVLGAIFARSAVPKLRQPDHFVLAVYEYRVVPPPLAYAYARVLPSAEIVAAVLLLSGMATRVAALLSIGMLMSFLAAILANLLRGRKVDCNCFGSAGRKIGWGLVMEDLFLALLCAVVLFTSIGWVGAEGWSVFRLPSSQAAEALALATVCVFAAAAGPVLLGRRTRRVNRVARKEVAIQKSQRVSSEQGVTEGRVL